MLGLSSNASFIHLIIQTVMNFGEKQQSCNFPVQNLTLTKPKKKMGKVFGHSRTLSRVEDLGVMVVKHLNLTQCLNFHLSSWRLSIPSLKQACYDFPSLWPLQFTSSHLSTSNSASVKSVPDYVYSQLSSPHVTSPEAKKLHQEIYGVSQRGTNLSCSEVN